MIGTIDASSTIDEDGILLLLEVIGNIWLSVSRNFCNKVEDVFRRPEVYDKEDIVANNQDLLELQYINHWKDILTEASLKNYFLNHLSATTLN